MGNGKHPSELTVVWADICIRYDITGNPECIHIDYEDDNGEEYWGMEVVDNEMFVVVTINDGIPQPIFRREYEEHLEWLKEHPES